MSANDTAAATDPSATVPSLDSTFGSILVCTYIGFMLYGLTVHQTYRYFCMYRHDIHWIKMTVISLLCADTAHLILYAHASYYYLITSYSDPDNLEYGTWSMRLSPGSAAVVILIAQGFYMRRVYRIGPPYRHLLALACTTMIISGAFAVAATVEAWKKATFEDWESSAWLTSVAFACAVGTDVVLTGSLIVFLRRSRTGFERTDTLLNTLVVYTINTGLLTSTLSIACMAFALAQPNGMIYTAISVPATKSYANSVLAVLNSRRSLKDVSVSETPYDFGSFGMSAVQFGQGSRFVSTRRATGGFLTPPSNIIQGKTEELSMPASTRGRSRGRTTDGGYGISMKTWQYEKSETSLPTTRHSMRHEDLPVA